MIMVLGIETATSLCGVAIVENEKVSGEFFIDKKYIHSVALFKGIQHLFKQLSLSMQALSGVAVSIGPGSYTGLRIGLSAAKGFAYGLGIPILTIPTLDALAHPYLEMTNHVCAVIPTVRDLYYYAIYSDEHRNGGSGQVYDRASLGEVLDKLPRECFLVGKVDAEDEKIHNKKVRIASKLFSFPRAAVVAHLGQMKLLNGEYAPLGKSEPLYLREFPESQAE